MSRKLPSSYREHKYAMQDFGRNMDSKGHSDEISEMRNVLLENGEEAILVTKWQRTWLNCVQVLMFCGRSNW